MCIRDSLPDDMLMEMGIDMQQFSTGNEALVWLILPMLCACTIAVVQLTISIFAGAIAGYIVSIVYLVVSVYLSLIHISTNI